MQLSTNNYRRGRSFVFTGQQDKGFVKHQPMMRVRTMSEGESSTVSNKPDDKQELAATEESIFRRRMDADDVMEDMWTLKRANAFIDEDDEAPEIYASPSKRQCNKLNWDDCCSSSDQRFQLTVSTSGEFILG
jgi:hypothetical protein